MEHYEACAHRIASAAQKAVLYEATAAPKPGLVDRLGQGAHKDMDIFTFMSSSSALYKGMYSCALAGLRENKAGPELFWNIRPIGVECEADMLKATNGVNTHKGIIFSMGILCAATGVLYRKRSLEHIKAEDVCAEAAAMCSGLVDRDFNKIKVREKHSHGEKLFMEYGITGIRGEAQGGFSTVIEKGIAILRSSQLREKLELNDLLLHALMNIMACCQDTNVVIRGGLEGLQLVQESARRFMTSGGMLSKNGIEKLQELDRLFIEKNISPGGSADLLSLSVFLADVEGIGL